MTGRVLAHQRFGEGARPLVLLHGFLGSGRNLTSLGRALAASGGDLSVIVPDLAGHGGSPPLPPGADLADLARDVMTTAGALDLPSPLTLVGHSLGGRVALRAAGIEAGSRLIRQVTLLDIGPSAVPRSIGETGRVLDLLLAAPPAAPKAAFRSHFRAGGLDGAVVEWLLLNLVAEGDRHRWVIDRAALADLQRRTGAEDLWAVVERTRDWALRCVRGARSPYVSDADARRLEAAGCPVTTIEGAGHFLHVERPAEVLATVRAGLADQPVT